MSTVITNKTREERVSFSSITQNNLGTVRKLNSVLFVKYSDKFYKDLLTPEWEEFCKLIYLNDIPVGTICGRIETSGEGARLYLMTMGVLAPYRSRGIGAKALELVLKAAEAHVAPALSKVTLHVQVSNTTAKAFYERHGFAQVDVVQDYYKKIEPRDAWLLERSLKASTSS